MPETKKAEKIRLYKFAAEYNLSTETLLEFLKEKKFKVKSHMSILTDEMLAAIYDKFKKDIELAEKHYKKILEFKKAHGELPEEEEKPEVTTEEKESEAEKEPEEKVEETKEEEITVEHEPEEEQQEETTEEKEEEPVVAEKEDEPEVYLTETERELKEGGGLKIVGKIDTIEEEKKESVQDKKELTPEGEEKPVKKKKKKKVLKAKKKAMAIDGEELKKSKKKKKVKRFEIDKKEIDKTVKQTLLSLEESGIGDRASKRKKKRKEKKEQLEIVEEQKQLEKKKIHVTEFVAVGELANLMGIPVSEVIQKFMSLGLMVTVNQRLDVETISLVAEEFGFEVVFEEEVALDKLADFEDPPESLKPRPPVVTIMGHVDHGKTSLLDYIRKANVVAGEAGGITQHIGAYKVKVDDEHYITFLDTPGHEAFTAMRARGASVTDIVVLIVAADDAVMPQTVEAINHAQAAGVPIIVAINKIDKPNANVEKIKQQLAERNVLVEDWGGKYQSVEISAKMGTNVDLLLEKILLEAEILELKANPDRKARGAIIETTLEKGRGITATVLVQKGTLRIGEPFVAGNQYGRVRAMFDERNKKVKEAPPSTPVLVLGFEGAPQAGDVFVVVESERDAREISIKRQQIQREQERRQKRHITLDEIASQISEGKAKELAVIIKGDVDGSVEALSDALVKLSTKDVKVNIVHKGVGAISESDVLLASVSNAIIVGFHVRPNSNARKLAEKEKVDIRLYNVIYDCVNEIKSALEGMLSPVITEEVAAVVEVREIFKVPKVGTVAGCYVQEGKITRNQKIRLFRDGVAIYEGQLASLKRFKDDVKEVDAGYECGLSIQNFNDIKVGDIIEGYKTIETKQFLE